MDVTLHQNDAADWIYRGEGAANLVLAYTGSSPDFVGKVMRIQKVPRNRKRRQCVHGEPILSRHEQILWRDVEEMVTSCNTERVKQLYAEHIMCPLLGSEYVDAGMRVLVSREFLESVQKKFDSQRPAWRVDAAEIDTLCAYVLILSDHALFPSGNCKEDPCIAVEIKPKCGFLPISRFIAEENIMKKRVSRFRMHQVLKLHQQQISDLSDYDPLDLSSGSRERIHRAIKALYTTPQNNFRVFLDGSLIFGGLGGGTGSTNSETENKFDYLLKCIIPEDNGLRTVRFIELVGNAVYHSGILDRLLEVQKLDNFDIEGAIHAYYNTISQPCKVCGEEVDGNRVLYSGKFLHSMPLDESLKIVKDYLVAATSKDCSLMICFRPRKYEDSRSSYNSIYLDSINQVFDYKVHFIDLDLKHMEKMDYYYELDKKIVKYYTQMVNTQLGVKEATNHETCRNNPFR